MKTHKHKPIRIWVRQVIASVLALVLLCGLLPVVPMSAQAATDWAQEYLDKLVSWGVMRGDQDGNLHAENNITRAELVAMINRAYGYDRMGDIPFEDVTPDDWFADDIAIAYNVGYFSGTSETTASPNLEVTREQAVVLLARNMMLKGTPGETLGFTDSHDFSGWSHDLIQPAVNAGIITGDPSGAFRPKASITRAEIASMLSKAIGNPVQEEGESILGNVYGNITISKSNVTLKNTVIAGDLYLTGGIGLGNVLLENVTVLGRIVASGAGASEKGDSSIILRNVTSDEMVVDSISNQLVSIRAEGDTIVGKTSVRTPAFLEDQTRANFGMKVIELDGENGIEVSLAGNIKEVVNRTPESNLIMGQGTAQMITIDEAATGSKMTIENGATVKTLNLDTGVPVTGGGDIETLNVNANGSTVEMLPDNINIRPGITAEIAGEEMDDVAGKESSSEPRLLAGYPEVRDIAPTSAVAIFSANKPGTIYWAVSTVSDGSVSEADVISPPSYGNKIVQSGSIQAETSDTEYTAQLSELSSNGSFYLTAVMVDSRGQHSPVKVTAFSTPDDTVPEFAKNYPVMTKITSNSGQVTVMTNKNCLVYYALLPKDSIEPSPQDFKANAITGNLGYGSLDTVKNSTLPFTVNNIDLEELQTYDLYLWLTDYDGAQSSKVQKLTFTTIDGTPPYIEYMDQTDAKTNAIEMTFALNEPGTLYWAVVKEGKTFFRPLTGQTIIPVVTDDAAKMQVEAGLGAIAKGQSKVNAGSTAVKFNITGLEAQTNYDLYYVAKDTAGNYSVEVQKITVSTQDDQPPTVKQEFTLYNEDNTEAPLPDTNIRLVFSESIQGMETVNGEKVYQKFMDLYNAVERSKGSDDEANLREQMAIELRKHIQLYEVPSYGQPKTVPDRGLQSDDDSSDATTLNAWIDFRYVDITLEDGQMILTFENSKAVNLASGGTYYFALTGIADTAATPNLMGNTQLPRFTTVFAQVVLTVGNTYEIKADELEEGSSDGQVVRVDMGFLMDPLSTDRVNAARVWDALLWTDTSMTFTLYAKEVTASKWTKLGSTSINVAGAEDGYAFTSLTRRFKTASGEPIFEPLRDMKAMEYAIHVDKIGDSDDYTSWNQRVSMKVTVVTGTQFGLNNLSNGSYTKDLEVSKTDNGTVSIGLPDPFEVNKIFTDSVAPQFVDNYPTIEAGDIAAEIDVMIDRPGVVYYVAVPLNQVKYDPPTSLDPKDIVSYACDVLPTVRDTSLTDVISKGMPLPKIVPTSGAEGKLELTTPGVNTITGGTFTGNVRYGKSVSMAANNAATIRVENLIPDTVYYIYLVTQGTSAIYSNYALCYRFKTEKSVRPVITMDISNPNVRVTVDKDSRLDYILVVTGKEDSRFYDKLSSYADNSSALPSEYQNMTVLDAMSTDIIQGTSSIGTVFDLYANDAAKNLFASLIRNQGLSGTDVVMKGSDTFLASDAFKLVETQNMEGTNYYTFLAVGRSTMGSGDAFRAIRPVFQRDTDPPYVITADFFGRVDQTTKVITEGYITLGFSDPLYTRSQGTTDQTTHPVDQCDPSSSSHTGNESVSIVDMVTSQIGITGINISTTEKQHGQPTSTITLSVKDAYEGAHIIFSATLCDRSGNIHEVPLTIALTLVPKLQDDGTIQYTMGISITKDWDARTTT